MSTDNAQLRMAINLSKQLAKEKSELEQRNKNLLQSQEALKKINIQVNQTIIEQMKAARNTATAFNIVDGKTSLLGSTQGFLAKQFAVSTSAMQQFSPENLNISLGDTGVTDGRMASTNVAPSLNEGQKFAFQEIAAAKVLANPSTGRAQDPYAQIELQKEQKLGMLKQYQDKGDLSGVQQYEDAKTAILAQAAAQRQAIQDNEAEQNQKNLGSLLEASSGFAGAIMNVVAESAGKTSSAYQTLFAISKGFALAQASLNLQVAISTAMTTPWPAKIGAIANAVSAGSSVVSAISSMSYGGGRKNGGSVFAGSIYRVGEGGLPEIYQASSGRQYMIPGDNGKVIGNQDIVRGSGQAVNQNLTFNISSQGQGIDQQTMKQIANFVKGAVVSGIAEQQRSGGMLAR